MAYRHLTVWTGLKQFHHSHGALEQHFVLKLHIQVYVGVWPTNLHLIVDLEPSLGCPVEELQMYGISGFSSWAIWSLYNRSESFVHVDSEKSNLLPVDAEIHQGFPLSPTLYITFMDLFIFCSIQEMGVSGGVRFVFAFLKTMWFYGLNKLLD